MSEQRKDWVAWNESKTEGVVFNDKRDAEIAAGLRQSGFLCSALADHFREAYGQEEDCSVEPLPREPERDELVEVLDEIATLAQNASASGEDAQGLEMVFHTAVGALSKYRREK